MQESVRTYIKMRLITFLLRQGTIEPVSGHVSLKNSPYQFNNSELIMLVHPPKQVTYIIFSKSLTSTMGPFLASWEFSLQTNTA